MIIPIELNANYNRTIQLVEIVATKARASISNFCEINGWLFQGRIKTRESLAEKIEMGWIQCWTDINDIYACKIIINTLSDETAAIEFVQKTFNCPEHLTKLRGQAKKSPDKFAFDATRITAFLVPPPDLEIPTNSIYSIPFEVQILTVLEHAWSSATHKLTYKTNKISWRKQRLTAQIKATLEQLDLLLYSYDLIENNVPVSNDPETEDKIYISCFFDELFQTGLIDPIFKPKDVSRFTENLAKLVGHAKRSERDRNLRSERTAVNACNVLRQYFATQNPPPSISLYQVCLGVLIREEFLKNSTEGPHLHITSEMEIHFPETRSFSRKFTY